MGRRHNKGIGPGVLVVALLAQAGTAAAQVQWPALPDAARVVHVESVALSDLEPARGFLGSVVRVIFGGKDENPRLPQDVLATAGGAYLTCQDYPALVLVDFAKREYRTFVCDELPLQSPIALEAFGDDVLVSDSGRGVVYRLHDDKLEPWLRKGLVRPTGVAVSADGARVFVVDTGAHAVRVFDATDGSPVQVAHQGNLDVGWHFPTFAARAGADILINDTLNYRVVRVAANGQVGGAFGQEGDGPGAFARPKGLGVDSDGHVWVADGLFDNIQVFEPDGSVLLVIGGRGSGPGEFWSPTGLDFDDDRVLVADTFNNRIQVLRYLGGEP